MIVVSRNLQLALPDAFGLNADSPVIGWHNLVDLASISADEEADNYPAAQLANPATNLLWRGESTAEQHLTLSISSADPIDYLAVARHNFGSAAIPVSVEGDSGSGFEELVQEMRNPLYVTEAIPMGFGLNMAKPFRNLLLVTFENREQGARRGT